MERRTFIGVLSGSLLAAPLVCHGQTVPTLPRVGLLRPGSPPDPYVDAFRQRLTELGYVERRSIAFEYRWAEGKPTRLRKLAAELVQQKVDVIVTQGEEAARAVKEATSAIPIVMATSGDPVRAGLVASLAHPGGNITGLSAVTPDVIRKQLQLLKEALPGVSRVAMLSIPDNRALAYSVREAHSAAVALGLTLQPREVRAPDDLSLAFDEMTRNRAQALFLFADIFTIANQRPIFELASRRRLPTMCSWLESTDCLMGYGTNRLDMFRLAAAYVDKILKGAKPADLPIEQPTKFELVINLKTARALGLSIPPSLLQRADEVIE